MRAFRLLGRPSVGLLALILVACGQVGQPLGGATATLRPVARQEPTTTTSYQGTPLPHGWTLITYTAAIPYSDQPGFTSQAELRVTAGCHPGERMVGAGYAATDVFEYNATIASSYPINDHSWSVTGGTQAGIQLDVYCLHGDHLPTVVIINGPFGAVACPADSVALAEGFGPPAGSGSEQTSYALCATSGVQAGSRTTSSVVFDSSQNGYNAASASARCPTGQIALGGGATGVAYFASGTNADFAGWTITGGGNGSGTVFAMCVRLL